MYRLLVESVRDYAIFALDSTGHIVSWNEGARQIKGYEADEIIGQHFSIFYPPEDLAWGKPQYELSVAARVGRFEDEGWRVRKDGTRFWANVVITALRNPSGDLVGYAKVTRDLTERQHATERAITAARRIAVEEAARSTAEARATELAALAAQLERRTEEAETANHAKAEFLAAMSHELRTPLNAIGGYAELIALGLRGPLTDEQRQDIERIRRSQQHLLGIINDILNFSRIEAGHLTYDIGPVMVGEVLENVRLMIAPQAEAKGVRYEQAECPQDALWVVRADRMKVEQILLNLLSNAVKFTEPGGQIILSCEGTASTIRLHVRDTGVGIVPDKLEAIFEPFVQVGRSLTQGSGGTGLGLAISRDLARAMGGDVTAVSTVGAGSTFTLTLARSDAAATETSTTRTVRAR